MSKRWDDLLSETPTTQHTQSVRAAVEPLLSEAKRKRHRHFWIWLGGLGMSAASIFAGVHVVRREAGEMGHRDQNGEMFAELLESGLENSALMQASLELSGDDMAAVDDLDLLEEIRDEDFEVV